MMNSHNHNNHHNYDHNHNSQNNRNHNNHSQHGHSHNNHNHGHNHNNHHNHGNNHNSHNNYHHNHHDNSHSQTDKDELLKRLSILDFMLLDLGLYLNNNPHDEKALCIYNQVAHDANAMRKNYEKTHGPLTARQSCYSGDSWQWIKEPWPWQSAANFCVGG